MNSIETRYAPIESDGRMVRGVVMRYGDAAQLPDGRRERIEAGAFAESVAGDIILNFLHERRMPLCRTPESMTLTDTATALRMQAELPDTTAGKDAQALIRAGVMRGLSIEFRVTSERMEADTRVVTRAELVGLAIVDRPAYPESIIDRAELRMTGGGVELRFHYERDHIISDRMAVGGLPELRGRYGRGYGAAGRGRRDRVRKQRIRPGAFKRSLSDPENEIVITLGARAGKPLGSKFAGSAAFVDGPEFLAARVEKLPDTTYVHDWREQVRSGAATFGVAPLFRKSTRDGAVDIMPESENEGVNIEVINEATLTGMAVVERPPKGNAGAVKLDGAPVGKRARSRRLWL